MFKNIYSCVAHPDIDKMALYFPRTEHSQKKIFARFPPQCAYAGFMLFLILLTFFLCIITPSKKCISRLSNFPLLLLLFMFFFLSSFAVCKQQQQQQKKLQSFFSVCNCTSLVCAFLLFLALTYAEFKFSLSHSTSGVQSVDYQARKE